MFRLIGEFNELSSRLPSLISGTLGVLLMTMWGSVVFSRQVGLIAGIVLATNFLYCGLARTAGIDMMLTLFTTAALCCFSIGLECRISSADKKMRKRLCTPLFLLTAVWIGDNYFHVSHGQAINSN